MFSSEDTGTKEVFRIGTQAWLARKWTIWRCISFLEKGFFPTANHATVYQRVSHRFTCPLPSDAFLPCAREWTLGTGDGEFEGPSAVQSEPPEHLDFATWYLLEAKRGTACFIPELGETVTSKPNQWTWGWINIPFFCIQILWKIPFLWWVQVIPYLIHDSCFFSMSFCEELEPSSF